LHDPSVRRRLVAFFAERASGDQRGALRARGDPDLRRSAYPRSVATAWLANKTAQNIASWLPVAEHDSFFFLQGELVEGVALVARQRHFELICVHPEVQRTGVAKRLFAAILTRLQPTRLEAHAPLPSVNWYLKHGFTIRAAPLVEEGVLWDIPR
jgi:GNAT superfamily N-acetyltransferase